MKRLLFSLSFLLFLIAPLHAGHIAPLSSTELESVIPNSTFTGRFKNSNRQYAIYFAPNGETYLQKEGWSDFQPYGHWKIIDNLIESRWPYEDLSTDPSKKMNFYTERDLRTYKLQLFQVPNGMYEPFRPRFCNCESSPEVYFPRCSRSPGKVPL